MSKRCSISSTELFTIISEHLSKSIELKDFLPEILQTIQLYLNCEQVFICYFNSGGEEEIMAGYGEKECPEGTKKHMHTKKAKTSLMVGATPLMVVGITGA